MAMTQEERDAQDAKAVLETAARAWLKNRKNAYIAEGWNEPWDLLDDILDQLADAGTTLPAKTERDTIKTNNPK